MDDWDFVISDLHGLLRTPLSTNLPTDSIIACGYAGIHLRESQPIRSRPLSINKLRLTSLQHITRRGEQWRVLSSSSWPLLFFFASLLEVSSSSSVPLASPPFAAISFELISWRVQFVQAEEHHAAHLTLPYLRRGQEASSKGSRSTRWWWATTASVCNPRCCCSATAWVASSRSTALPSGRWMRRGVSSVMVGRSREGRRSSSSMHGWHPKTSLWSALESRTATEERLCSFCSWSFSFYCSKGMKTCPFELVMHSCKMQQEEARDKSKNVNVTCSIKSIVYQ